jgi:enamine deaminase RidA (YjgF/YER057c/UK114 family)
MEVHDMSDHIEFIEVGDGPGDYSMPYTPAIAVRSGQVVYLAGVTAAPIYHSHPHIPSEFDDIPRDPGKQAEMAMENVLTCVRAAGGELGDIVELTTFMVDQNKNQKAVGAVMARYWAGHRPASTSVEVVRLATDPRLILELKAVAVVPNRDVQT